MSSLPDRSPILRRGYPSECSFDQRDRDKTAVDGLGDRCPEPRHPIFDPSYKAIESWWIV
jgi:hypothetical protein